jgi:hypothetical protein
MVKQSTLFFFHPMSLNSFHPTPFIMGPMPSEEILAKSLVTLLCLVSTLFFFSLALEIKANFLRIYLRPLVILMRCYSLPITYNFVNVSQINVDDLNAAINMHLFIYFI